MQAAVNLVLVLVQLLMASLALAGRVVLREVPPGFLVLVRVTGAATVLMMVHRALRLPLVQDRADLWKFAILGFLGVSANQTLFLLGLQHTTAVNATILVTTIPVFTVLASLVIRREPPSGTKIAGIALAGAGAIYLIGPDRISLAPEVALGNALILLGMFSHSLYLVMSKPMLERYRPLVVSYYVMLFGALGVLPFGLFTLGGAHIGTITPRSWILIAYIVLGPTILAYFLNIWALKRVSPNLVAVYIYLQPLFAATLTPFILPGETITSRAVTAGAGIFLGLGLVIWAERIQGRQLPAGEAIPGE